MSPNRRKVKSATHDRPADGHERGRDFQGEAEMARSALHRPRRTAHHRNALSAVASSFNMLGEFNFLDEKLQDTTGVLPPKKQTEFILENWEAPNP